MGANTIAITEANFEEKVLQSDKPVLLDFWAEWCAPCKQLAPIVDEVASELADDAVVGNVNIDEERNLAMKFQIRSIPTLLVFKDGEEVARQVGAIPKAQIVALLK